MTKPLASASPSIGAAVEGDGLCQRVGGGVVEVCEGGLQAGAVGEDGGGADGSGMPRDVQHVARDLAADLAEVPAQGAGGVARCLAEPVAQVLAGVGPAGGGQVGEDGAGFAVQRVDGRRVGRRGDGETAEQRQLVGHGVL